MRRHWRAEFVEKDARHVGIEVLTGADHHLVQRTAFAQRARDDARFDELRAGAEDDENLHAAILSGLLTGDGATHDTDPASRAAALYGIDQCLRSKPAARSTAASTPMTNHFNSGAAVVSQSSRSIASPNQTKPM